MGGETIKIANLLVLDAAREMFLFSAKVEQKLFNARLEPVPELAQGLQGERYAHRNGHVDDDVARPHGIDHSHLTTPQSLMGWEQEFFQRTPYHVPGMVDNLSRYR